MSKSLKAYSKEELELELRRRKGDLLSDFYFFEEESDEVYDKEEPSLRFLITHKRRWHMEHCTDDGVFDRLIHTRLPSEFYHLMESTFEYKPKFNRKRDEFPNKKDAVKALKVTGAKEIKNPWFESLLTHMVKFESMDKHFRISANADTEEIKDLLWDWQKKNDNCPDLMTYRNSLNGWAESLKLHAEFYNESDDFCKISVMKKTVWKKLPEYPR